MIRAFSRCSSDHYFSGTHCPLDGWTSPEAQELAAIVDELVATGAELTIAALGAAGLSAAGLRRTIVIAFGDPELGFESIAAAGWVFDGHWVESHEWRPR